MTPPPKGLGRTDKARKTENAGNVTGGNKPHGPARGEPRPARAKSTGEPCRDCIAFPPKCFRHGGRSTGPKTARGKREVRKNAVKHGLYSDPLVFLDNMPPGVREAFEERVAELAASEGVAEPADMIVVRDLVLADLIQQRGTQYLLNEWTTKYRGSDGVPTIAEGEALSQWERYSRLKTQLRAALRQGTGTRGDPGAHHVHDRIADAVLDDPEAVDQMNHVLNRVTSPSKRGASKGD